MKISYMEEVLVDFKTRQGSFYNRFGLEMETDREKEILGFKMGILNCIEQIDGLLSKDEIIQYCTNFGIKAEFKIVEHHESGRNIYNIISEEIDFHRLLLKIETLLNLDFDNTNYLYGKMEPFSSQDLYEKIAYVFKCTLLCINISESQGKYLIYPAGEKFLDEELVEKPLKFLDKKSNEHFISAIKHYNTQNKMEFIKAAESIRRCLEEFLRENLNNYKGLKANIDELGSVLKQNNGLKQISNNIYTVFDTLDKLFNENSKHNSGNIDEADCEYLIYQCGVLINYIRKKNISS